MKYKFFASCPPYVEDILSDELDACGAPDIKLTRGGISWSGTLETAYRGCLWSRVGNRIILELESFPARSPEEIYEQGLKIPWQDHMSVSMSFRINTVLTGNPPYVYKYAALKLKDALCDYFRKKTGKRPNVDRVSPDMSIVLLIDNTMAGIGIALSGESLHKRGYREHTVDAPLKENVAAAMLYRAGWPDVAQSRGTFFDPMCGSGTLLIEAAHMAGDIAPGLKRSVFGFSKWKGHEEKVWDRILEEAWQRKEEGLSRIPSFFGFDYDGSAIEAALLNIEEADLSPVISLKKQSLKDISSSHVPSPVPGLIAVNPPYGKRLGKEEEIAGLYRDMGRLFKKHFPGWRAAVLAGSRELAKNIGLRATKINKLNNGKIHCILATFDLTEDNRFVDTTLK